MSSYIPSDITFLYTHTCKTMLSYLQAIYIYCVSEAYILHLVYFVCHHVLRLIYLSYTRIHARQCFLIHDETISRTIQPRHNVFKHNAIQSSHHLRIKCVYLCNHRARTVYAYLSSPILAPPSARTTSPACCPFPITVRTPLHLYNTVTDGHAPIHSSIHPPTHHPRNASITCNEPLQLHTVSTTLTRSRTLIYTIHRSIIYPFKPPTHLYITVRSLYKYSTFSHLYTYALHPSIRPPTHRSL